ncbi:MAG: glycosyltransferase family 39 protein [Pirellulales bacterium]|nr:glycosyltransferase family 39 protein [Pirellulales bacterium]
MSLATNLFTIPPTDAPFGQLRAPSEPLERRRWALMIGGLLLLWFIPRALLALKLKTISPDSVFFMNMADSLALGDRTGVLATYDFNLFPISLMWLHQWCAAPEIADRWYCVLLSTVLVVPLFAVVRRLFDTNIALLTSIFCGVHPKLIIQSPEILREPLFWCLFLTALYLLIRAFTELRVWQFLGAGLVMTFALHTRFEGWFLLIPFAWWLLAVGWRDPAARTRLARGAVIFLAANPLFLLFLNVTWLHDQPHWELGNFRRLHYVERWMESLIGIEHETDAPPAPPAPAAKVLVQLGDEAKPKSTRRVLPVEAVTGLVASPVPAPIPPWQPDDTPQPLTTQQTIWPFVRAMERGIGPVFLLLMAVAGWHWRRLSLRPGIGALSLIGLTNMAAVWIHLWFGRESSSRYALLVLLLWSPWAALGFNLVAGWIDTQLTQLLRRRLPWHAGVVVLIVLGLAHCAYPLSKGDTHRRAVADLGRWIANHYGAQRTIIGPSEMHSLMPYYTRGRYSSPWPALSAHDYVAFLVQQRAEFVILTKHPIDDAWYASVKQAESSLGYDDITDELPPEVRGRFVLLRSHHLNETVRQAQVPKHPYSAPRSQ